MSQDKLEKTAAIAAQDTSVPSQREITKATPIHDLNKLLKQALHDGNEALSLQLLREGAQVNTRDSLRYAARFTNTALLQAIFRSYAGDIKESGALEDALDKAISCDNIQNVRYLLASGADVNHKKDDRHSFLNQAFSVGSVELVRLLLAHPAMTSEHINESFRYMVATTRNRNTHITLDEEHRDIGITDSAMILKQEKSYAILSLLLTDSRTNVDSKDKSGRSARSIATFTNNSAILALFPSASAPVGYNPKLYKSATSTAGDGARASEKKVAEDLSSVYAKK